MASPEFDLVIRNGSIVDGSGAPPHAGDVAVRDGWIVAVGKVEGSGKREIDAKGKLVTPGFIDIHTHYDGQVIWSDRVAPSSQHGVTTVVVGNCGVGFAPCKPEHREKLIELMEGVEDIPNAVTGEGLTWDWESFPEFMDAVERRPHDIDIAVLVPHSPIRVYTMGEKAIRREPANAEERASMRKLVREALDVGALGFGTSRMAAHRSSKGELIPSFEAEEIELVEIADEMRLAGKGVFQIVPNTGFASYESQLPILERIAAAGRTLTYTHAQFGDWRKGLALLEESNAKPGVEIKAQLLPRPVGMMLGLTLSAHSFCTTPTYLRIKHLPLPELVAEMKKPEVRQAILTETPENPTNPLITFTRRYERIFPVNGPINYEPALEQSFAGLAKAKQGWTAAELAYDNLLEDGGKAMQMLTIANYEDCNLDWCETLFESDSVVMGLGDGGAHYGMICDASYTTFALSHWTRDRTGGKRSVEDMVHRLTREPAELMGLLDRGLVAPGHRANLNVIDYDKLSVRNPHIVADLPAGGKRLHQEANGYVATIVNGAVIVDNDRPTDARPGKLVRGAQQPR